MGVVRISGYQSGYQVQYGTRYDKFTFLYDVGDLVKIRQEDVIPPSWDWDYDSMNKYCGETAQITRRYVEDATNVHYYELDIDGGKYDWTNQMLDKFEVDAAREEKDIVYTPGIDEASLVWNFSMFIQGADLGKVVGNFICAVDGDVAKITADLEGNRRITLEVKEK